MPSVTWQTTPSRDIPEMGLIIHPSQRKHWLQPDPQGSRGVLPPCLLAPSTSSVHTLLTPKALEGNLPCAETPPLANTHTHTSSPPTAPDTPRVLSNLSS